MVRISRLEQMREIVDRLGFATVKEISDAMGHIRGDCTPRYRPVGQRRHSEKGPGRRNVPVPQCGY